MKKNKQFGKYIALNHHRMHLYTTSAESAFKGLGVFFTWGGTIFIYLLNNSEIKQDALLFFALGIILEYLGRFVSEGNRGKLEQLLPGILSIIGIFIYFFAFIQVGMTVTNEDVSDKIYKFQVIASCVTVAIIFIDMLLKICVKDFSLEQNSNTPESKLKNI